MPFSYPLNLRRLHPVHQHTTPVSYTNHRNDEECPLAYVVLRAKDAATPDEIAGFVEGRVAKHKRLTGGVKIVEEIRKNPVCLLPLFPFNICLCFFSAWFLGAFQCVMDLPIFTPHFWLFTIQGVSAEFSSLC